MKEKQELEEELVTAWVRLTAALKNTRLTQGMIYNEAIVMMIAYNKYREDGEGLVSFKDLVRETKMLKSLMNRTIDSLVAKNYLVRQEGEDRRTTYVKPVPENLDEFLKVHNNSVVLAREIITIIGKDDAEAFVRISEKISDANPVTD